MAMCMLQSCMLFSYFRHEEVTRFAVMIMMLLIRSVITVNTARSQSQYNSLPPELPLPRLRLHSTRRLAAIQHVSFVSTAMHSLNLTTRGFTSPFTALENVDVVLTKCKHRYVASLMLKDRRARG